MNRWPCLLRSKTCEGGRLHPAEDAGLAYSRLASSENEEKTPPNSEFVRFENLIF